MSSRTAKAIQKNSVLKKKKLSDFQKKKKDKRKNDCNFKFTVFEEKVVKATPVNITSFISSDHCGTVSQLSFPTDSI